MPVMVDSMFTPGYQHIVAAVVAMRREAGLTQRQLAQALGREQNLVARIETGQRRVDIVEFIWICRVCKRDAETELRQLAQSIRAMPLPRRKRAPNG